MVRKTIDINDDAFEKARELAFLNRKSPKKIIEEVVNNYFELMINGSGYFEPLHEVKMTPFEKSVNDKKV
jgi:chemotaxis methyl-accepting protein methylase